MIRRSRAKLFSAIVATPAAMIMAGAFSLNAIVDPLWVMPVFGSRPFLYCVKDERQNKINRMIHGRLNADSVIIGSSRTAFIDTRHFKKNDVFNASVNGMIAVEYSQFVEVFKEYVQPPKVIYLGLDFFAYTLTEKSDESFSARNRTRKTKSSSAIYKLNTLLDPSTYEESLRTINNCSDPTYNQPTYRYDAVRYIPMQADVSVTAAKAAGQITRFAPGFTDERFTPEKSRYESYLKSVIEAAGGGRVIAFIPPITTQLLQEEFDLGRWDDYQEWLTILVDTFGEVRTFSGVNSFTKDLSKFYDSHHAYPQSWEYLVSILEGRSKQPDDDLGLVLTKESLPGYLKRLRSLMDRNPPSPEVARGVTR